MHRRVISFRLAAAMLGATACSAHSPTLSRAPPAAAPPACPGELLYNNICLPKDFPPRKPISKVYVEPGYVSNPPPHSPTVGEPLPINIDVGRQLFVDAFLIDGGSKGIRTIYHDAEYQDQVNPVLAPTELWEGRPPKGQPKDKLDMAYAFASAFSGGLWWDPAASIYKMWYRCGNGQCYATSHDGIKWDKPLDINNATSPLAKTNIVDNHNFDGSTIWLDLRPDTPKDQRYKMAVVCEVSCSHYTIKYSADGVNWRTMVNETGPTSDRATIFYNPFREKWVYSIKTGFESKDPAFNLGRSRKYWDGDDLVLAGNYTAQQPYNWTNADFLDPAVGCVSSAGNSFTQLYNLDAVAYESVLVGLFSIFTGKDCGAMCNVTGQRCSPYNRTGEWDSVFLGFSRDGFHWSRPIMPNGKHRVFLPMDDRPAPPWRWNKANVQSVGGGEHKFHLEIYFDEPCCITHFTQHYGLGCVMGNATVGMATLRRDGFASIETQQGSSVGEVHTHSIIFTGKHFFVNVGLRGGGQGSVVVSINNHTTGEPIAPFTAANCMPITTDSVRQAVSWQGAKDLSAVANKPVKLVIKLSGAAQLYSFWVSSSPCGESHGYVAAGGKGFTGMTDTHGSCVTSHTQFAVV